jgi:photosystem II stability/assembly factor-like uncharacterized protein
MNNFVYSIEKNNDLVVFYFRIKQKLSEGGKMYRVGLLIILVLSFKGFLSSQSYQNVYWNIQHPTPWNEPADNIKYSGNYVHFSAWESGSLLFFSSMDGGDSWRSIRIYPGLTNYQFDLSNSKVWVSGVKQIIENGATVMKGLLFSSNDHGNTWWLKKTFDSLDIRYLKFYDDNHGTLIGFKMRVVSGKSTPFYYIYHTSDEGNSWEEVAVNISYFQGSYQFLDNLHGWASTFYSNDNNILVTSDGGRTWSNILKTADQISTSSFSDVKNGWYLKLSYMPSKVIIMATKNGGKNWIEQFSVENAAYFNLSVIDSLNVKALLSVNTSSNPTELRLYSTSDGGNTWNITSKQPTAINNNYIFFSEKNTGWLTGSKGELLKTTDGGIKWINKQKSESAHILWGIDFIDRNFGWAVGGGRGTINSHEGVILGTNNGGNKWNVLLTDTTMILSKVDFTDRNNGFVIGNTNDPALNKGIILKTIDGGLNWSKLSFDSLVFNKILMINALSGFAVGAIMKDNINDINPGKNLLSSLILRTSDGGNTWNKCYTNYINKGTIKSIHFYNESMGYAVGDSFTILKTTNGGNTWQQTNGNLDYNVYSKTTSLSDVYFLNNNTGWVVGSHNVNPRMMGIILKTTDGGNTWDTLMTKYGLSFIVLPDSNNIMIQAVGGGIYYSSDRLKTLSLSTIFLGGSDMKFVDPENGWATRANGGIYRFKIERFEMTDISKENKLPEFKLSQNYPNPFNPSTMITFNLAKESNISLKIYSILGQEIATLVNDKLKAGEHKITWEPKNIANGVYFYRLSTDGKNEIKKMLFLK